MVLFNQKILRIQKYAISHLLDNQKTSRILSSVHEDVEQLVNFQSVQLFL